MYLKAVSSDLITSVFSIDRNLFLQEAFCVKQMELLGWHFIL